MKMMEDWTMYCKYIVQYTCSTHQLAQQHQKIKLWLLIPDSRLPVVVISCITRGWSSVSHLRNNCFQANSWPCHASHTRDIAHYHPDYATKFGNDDHTKDRIDPIPDLFLQRITISISIRSDPHSKYQRHPTIQCYK